MEKVLNDFYKKNKNAIIKELAIKCTLWEKYALRGDKRIMEILGDIKQEYITKD